VGGDYTLGVLPSEGTNIHLTSCYEIASLAPEFLCLPSCCVMPPTAHAITIRYDVICYVMM
jgi:hypothetical protein